MNRIRKRDLLRTLLRAFYIQGTWNYERMLGLGLCFCLIPIAKRLCHDKAEIRDFLNRHMDFFNSHPYMASYAIGALARLEEQSILQKWDDKRPITVFKERICGPLGAIGDALFWQFLKSFSAILGVIMALTIGWGSIIVFLGVFNIPHIYFRTVGILKGYFKGFDIIRDLSIRGTKKYFSQLSIIMNFIIGVLAVTASQWIYSQPNHDKTGVVVFFFLTLLSTGLTYRKKLSMTMTMIIILCISIMIGLMV